MFFKQTLIVAAATGLAMAQRPTDTSICDYYTTAALKNNTAANQMTLLTLVVNTAVIGNCVSPPFTCLFSHSLFLPSSLPSSKPENEDFAYVPQTPQQQTQP